MAKRTYANNTKVPVERSRAEIERTLAQYGADRFTGFWDKNTCREGIAFDHRGLMFSFEITTSDNAQERRRQWRALVLVIKAKLVAVDSGVSTFEEEFLAWACDNRGRRLGDILIPKLVEIAKRGLPALPALEEIAP